MNCDSCGNELEENVCNFDTHWCKCGSVWEWLPCYDELILVEQYAECDQCYEEYNILIYDFCPYCEEQ
jgi:hypothetical protein